MRTTFEVARDGAEPRIFHRHRDEAWTHPAHTPDPDVACPCDSTGPKFTYEHAEVWLCPYCGSDANPGICSGCDKGPTLAQIFGTEPLLGSRKIGRPTCKHPLRMRSKKTGQCLECRRLAGRRYREAHRGTVRDEKPSISAGQEG